MGTSSSYTAPTSGGWPAAKRAATRFARLGGAAGGGSPRSVIAPYVRALGGAATAAAASAAGRSAAQRLGAFLAATAGGGLGPALAGAGVLGVPAGARTLADLAGRDPAEVLAALADTLADSGDTLEGAAARGAVLAVLEQFLADGGAGLAALDADGVAGALRLFLVEYVYQRMLEQIGAQLQNGALTGSDARQLELDIRAFIEAVVNLELGDTDPLALDWTGAEGEAVVGRLLEATYGQLAGGDTG